MKIVTLLVVGVAAWLLFRACRARHWTRVNYLHLFLVSLYPLGVTLKAVAGPDWDWLRWHLADVGFPVAIGWVFAQLLTRSLPATDKMTVLSEEMLVSIASMNRRMAALIPAFAFSVGYEVVISPCMAYLKRELPFSEGMGVGGFDWVDIACYAGGTLAALTLLGYWRLRLALDLPVIQANETGQPH